MKVKDIERMANIAWSPAKHSPILLAAGTAAQQFDASFSSNACLEIYSLNISDPSSEMEIKGTTNIENRFHKVIWSSHGSDSLGNIVGGCDNGIVQIYSASKLLAGEPSLLASHNKHNGSVHALDFNPFQGNLLATAAGESEIYIWDISKSNAPMTPGKKTEPYEDIVSIQWNRQVQHILASTFTTKCVVWDLRKNETIIKLTDTVSRIRWKVVAWHPDIATQLCLASEDDQAPVIQLWDLRYAAQPFKTLENHQKGILSVSWCSNDSDLLISSGKDNRILCWNPNSEPPELSAEIARTSQWNFDVTWCPQNPALIATPSFDGHVSVYSLMGGRTMQFQTTNKIADSFPGMDGYLQTPLPQQTTVSTSIHLSKPPKWLKKPIGASYGFGGKLITFSNRKAEVSQEQVQQGQMGLRNASTVYISQVVTETDLIEKSAQLEQALTTGNFIDYCRNKTELATDAHDKLIWNFIGASFEENNRLEFLNLLGYNLDNVNDTLNHVVGASNVDKITDGISHLNAHGDFNNVNLDEFELIAQAKKTKPFEINTDNSSEGLITQAILTGNVEAAVELCMKAKKYAESLIIARTGGEDLFMKTQRRYLRENDTNLSNLISSLVSQDWNNVIDNCNINNWKEVFVALLTHCNDLECSALCERLGDRLRQESYSNPKLAQDAQLCYIFSGSFDNLVSSWEEKANQSTDNLQELVELMMFLQRAREQQGRKAEFSGAPAELLSKYAFILASQGQFQTALNYLGTTNTDESVVTLRNRLLACLDQPLYGYAKQPSYAKTPSYNQYNTPNPISTPTPHWQQQQPPPGVQPPRPTSVGSAQGSTGLPRSKYVLDPSVQSNTMPASRMNPNPLVNMNSMYSNQPMHPVTSVPHQFNNYSYQTPQHLDPSSQQVPLSQPTPFIQQPPTSFAPRPVPSVPLNPMVSSQAPLNPVMPTPPPDNSIKSPAYPPNQQYGGSVDYGQPPLAGGPPKNIQSGWNDPPAFFKASKTQPKTEVVAQDPITHPIYGSAPVSNVPQMPNNAYPNQNFMNQTPAYGQPPPLTNFSRYQTQPSPAPAVEAYNPTAFNTQAISAGSFNTNAVNTSLGHQQPQVMGRVEQPQPIQKPPIPEEHLHMQTVFDELRSMCMQATNDPATKRKLEDVSRKLENLYDSLRDRKLAPDVLDNLHQMVQMIQNGFYAQCLELHQNLVSGPHFAQIASFMPSIKVLLQTALRLQVHLR